MVDREASIYSAQTAAFLLVMFTCPSRDPVWHICSSRYASYRTGYLLFALDVDVSACMCKHVWCAHSMNQHVYMCNISLIAGFAWWPAQIYELTARCVSAGKQTQYLLNIVTTCLTLRPSTRKEGVEHRNGFHNEYGDRCPSTLPAESASHREYTSMHHRFVSIHTAVLSDCINPLCYVYHRSNSRAWRSHVCGVLREGRWRLGAGQ